MKFNKYNNGYNIIGTKLKETRERYGLSQDVLSNKLALFRNYIISIRHIQNWE